MEFVDFPCKISCGHFSWKLQDENRQYRVFHYAGDHYAANRNSGREISNSGPAMSTPLFLRPKSKPAGREKPIRVAAIRVVTKYPTIIFHQMPPEFHSRDSSCA